MKTFMPYPHQEAGIRWIIEHPAAALIWGMGTGKTVTTLTALDRLLHDFLEDGPVLVIAPKRVALDTWTTEASTWEHLQHLRIRPIMGTAKQRIDALRSVFEGPFADIYAINRENVCWLIDHLGGRWPFPIVVVDELSSFKSAQAKRWKALRRMRGRIKRFIGLTGTPRPNGLEDLWPEMYLLDLGERLGKTLGAFRARYLIPDKTNGHVVYSYRPKEGAEAEVYDKISDICMSIKKEDVLSLPGQIYSDVVVHPPDALLKKYKKFEKEQVMEWWDAREAQKAAGIYQRCIREDLDRLLAAKPLICPAADIRASVVAGSAAALTNKLLQFANGAMYDENGDVLEIHDLKLEALEELVEQAGGDPVLILYAYQHDEARIAARIPCRKLDTSQDIRDWNEGKIPVAIAHPASIGHGLNLQYGGHILIWFGLTWSLELYQQANERLNRPGQTEVCRIFHIVLKGTHDERVLEALSRKEVGQAAAIEALRLEVLQEVARS